MLWRGRRGTEQAIGNQAAGDRFVRIESESLVTLDLPAPTIGATMRVLAQGITDDVAVAATARLQGGSLVPPAPVHLRADALPDGSTALRWVRRSRSGWDWIDGVDAPLAEESERYQVVLSLVGGGARAIESDVPWIVLDAESRLATLSAAVRQIGAHGLSLPVTLALELGEA